MTFIHFPPSIGSVTGIPFVEASQESVESSKNAPFFVDEKSIFFGECSSFVEGTVDSVEFQIGEKEGFVEEKGMLWTVQCTVQIQNRVAFVCEGVD